MHNNNDNEYVKLTDGFIERDGRQIPDNNSGSR